MVFGAFVILAIVFAASDPTGHEVAVTIVVRRHIVTAAVVLLVGAWLALLTWFER